MCYTDMFKNKRVNKNLTIYEEREKPILALLSALKHIGFRAGINTLSEAKL